MNEVIVIGKEQLQELISRIMDEKFAAIGSGKFQVTESIDTPGLCKRLGVSETTLLKYRNQGKIPYLQIGDLIRFQWPACLEKLEKSKKK